MPGLPSLSYVCPVPDGPAQSFFEPLVWEIPVRGLLLLAAAACIVTLGLGCRSDRYDQAYYYQGSQRTNLYPLTSPPPGSVQPVRGYGPTPVSSTQDYYGQGNYAGYNTGYYGTTQTAGYNPGYATGSYYGTGYAVSQDPFPPGTVGASGNTVANPFNPAGGYCRVEDVTANMNPTVPIKDPPVTIGNNINLGNTTPGYTASYTTTTAGYGVQQPYVSQASYTAPAATGSYAAGYATGGYGTTTYAAPPRLSATTISTTGPGIVSGPVPYCGPGVSCPPDPRVDTSMYGSGSNLPAGSQVQTTVGEIVGTADLVGGGASYGYTGQAAYGTTSYGASYGASPMVGAGYTTGTDTYRGGAYPSAIDTIPATHKTGSESFRNSRMKNNGTRTANAGGIRLVPALDVPPNFRSNDAGPSQWFEVIRPGNGPVRIGKISATCVCVGVRIPKRQYAAGERILIEARTLTRPPVNNLTYGIYVNVVEPVKTVVDADVTISL